MPLVATPLTAEGRESQPPLGLHGARCYHGVHHGRQVGSALRLDNGPGESLP
jgi:hypothetical protein